MGCLFVPKGKVFFRGFGSNFQFDFVTHNMNSKICLLCGRCCSLDAVEQLAAGRKSHEPQMQGLAHSARGNIICHENRKPVSSSQQQQLTQSAAPVTTERVAAQRN
jgi:hypothetical protein